MNDRAPADGWVTAALAVRMSLGVLWFLGTAGSLFLALFMGSSLAGETPTRAAVLAGDRDLIVAAVTAASAPLAALMVACLARDRGAVQRWIVAFLLGLTAAGLILHSRHDYLHQCLLTAWTAGPEGGQYCVQRSDAWRYAAPEHPAAPGP